jgi:hypothetical protein
MSAAFTAAFLFLLLPTAPNGAGRTANPPRKRCSNSVAGNFRLGVIPALTRSEQTTRVCGFIVKKASFGSAVALLLVLALAGCGGGGSSNGNMRPDGLSPTYVDLTVVTSPTSVPATSTAFNNSTTAFPAETLTPQIAVSNAPSVRVTIPELGVDDVFTMADIRASTFPATSGVQLTTFSHTSAGSTRTLTYVVPGQSVLPLRYSSLGYWEMTDLTTGVTHSVALSFGSRTFGTDIPTTGTASYAGTMIGTAVEGTALFSLTADAIGTANFGNRTLAVATNNSMKMDRTSGISTPDAGYNLTGTLSHQMGVNSLSGTLTSVNGRSGPALGNYYGPQAAEVGFTFQLNAPGGGQPFAGAAALRKQ